MENGKAPADTTEAFWQEKVMPNLVHDLVKTQDAKFCEERGNKLYQQKNYESALVHYSAAVQINPLEASLFNKRGMVFFKLKSYEKSLLDYTQAIELNTRPVFFYNRAIAFNALKRHEEALSGFMKALELDPWNLDVMPFILELRLKAKVHGPYF